MKAIPACCLMIIMTFLIFVGADTPSWGQASGNIIGVQFSPDGKQLRVQSDGLIGRHKAFVMGNPNRLVIDFDENGLRGIPRTIRGGPPGVKEVRLGYFNSRARVVVDFGETPVPPYHIHHEGARVLVALNKALAAAPVSPLSRKSVPGVKPAAKRQPAVAQESANDKKSPPVSIKSAKVVDDLIVLELSDTKSPQRLCRVVMEVDMDRLQVVRTTLSDAKGNLRSSEAPRETQEADTPAHQGNAQKGPRKQNQMSDEQVPPRPTLKWGLPEVKPREPGLARETAKGPFQLEQWVWKKRPESGG